MTTLVERLRRKAEYGIGSGEFYNDILVEAADRIEALEAEREKAVAVLREQPGYTVKIIAEALAILAPEPEGTVEEPPRDNSITDAW
jgi:hypothetical protein